MHVKIIKKHYKILLILLIFLILKIFSLKFYNQVWWDSAAYIGMGKYIYSSGNSGLWEASRPLVWPAILGFFWKIGLNILFFGRIIEIMFGTGCILLTYLIAKKLFNEKTALLSSLFLSLSPIFFFFNGIMLSEIVSTFFSLLAIYLFLTKRNFLSGLFFGIALMTRYLQALILISIGIFMVYNKKNFDLKHIKKIAFGFSVPAVLFLLINFILYKNPFLPFTLQFFLSGNSGWHNFQPYSFYFFGLIQENAMFFLVIAGIILIFRSEQKNNKLIPFAFLIPFVFFSLLNQKEMRFLIMLLPFMYILISHTIFHLSEKSKNKFFKNLLYTLIILSLFISSLNIVESYKNELKKQNQYEKLESEIKNMNGGDIWVSNPIIALNTESKVTPIYYPVFDEQKKTELISKYKDADYIILDSCDLACKPKDSKCDNDKKELIEFFKEKMEPNYYGKFNECEQFVFRN
ncbi:MAG TPA: glycosyltransferase family 39 protein [Candidatus Nanoarchaeia archaeon]|nr:glycosyltransferase family 39 protein [Candidatus Nanoarchaeia archaeon]